ncbi:hypothetical protein [Spirosoma sordidisoli]|uniref:Uncharacterized protein n=1 Tax=Spirosoma sordidisoli TaxID=2502893 RepID=A0A4Q2UHW6_9BACT|nr:hypothetical protein [Spirosoma sordidisoli]RYC66329.1 hypothetical protein EQG79_30100 [Spirosoma sordidisoli]
MSHRKPRQLDPTRSCFYELPETTPEPELQTMEAYYRRHYEAFEVRIKNRLYFTFTTTEVRDRFLLSYERGCAEEGILTQRSTIPQPDRRGSYYPEAEPGWFGPLDQLDQHLRQREAQREAHRQALYVDFAHLHQKARERIVSPASSPVNTRPGPASLRKRPLR